MALAIHSSVIHKHYCPASNQSFGVFHPQRKKALIDLVLLVLVLLGYYHRLGRHHFVAVTYCFHTIHVFLSFHFTYFNVLLMRSISIFISNSSHLQPSQVRNPLQDRLLISPDLIKLIFRYLNKSAQPPVHKLPTPKI